MSILSELPREAVPEADRRVTIDRRDPQIKRFEFHQRAQHFIMMSSVLLLVFTGMPQKFTTWPGTEWLIAFWGGVDRARFIHRMAGFAMPFSGAYHLTWLAALVFVKKQPLPMSM